MSTTSKFFAGLVLVVAVAVGGYYAWKSNASQHSLASISANAKLTDDQVSAIVANISNFLVVPANEKPSVQVISGADKLAAEQSFYQGAKDGNILVVYSSMTIIYDAKTNKLVNVGPIVRADAAVSPSPAASGSATLSPAPSSSPTPSVAPKAIKVDVRNGTSTAGLAGVTASNIKKNKLFTIGMVGDAKGSYTATVVVDLTKDDPAKAAAVAQLALLLNANVVTKMPAGEAASTADALVIVGK